jgi:hypothetical protein
MKYMESITDFMKSPKWMMNLLLAAICCFIPFVGPMVVLGWLITGFWCRKDESPATFPDFDFGNFVAWLQRGLWPFLVAIVASIAVYLVFFIPIVVLTLVVGGGSNHDGGLFAALGGLVLMGLELVMFLAMIFVLKPLMLKATLEQDFVKAFDFAFVKQFATLVWKEILISAIFLFAAGMVLSFAGLIALCVGVVLVPPILYYANSHIDKQLYKLYLSRGGSPITLSPKLQDAPPIPPITPIA